MRRLASLFVGAVVALGASSAGALGFSCITGNQQEDCTIGEAQLQVELTSGPAGNQVSFKFTNTGADAASITDVYFDDGAFLDAIASILDGTGVDFEGGASPSKLPGAKDANPNFVADFSADSEPAVEANGVNPGEELTVIFDLDGGVTFQNVVDAIANGSLRVGVHVQGFASEGSESFVTSNNVPEPEVALMFGVGLLGLALWNRHYERRAR